MPFPRRFGPQAPRPRVGAPPNSNPYRPFANPSGGGYDNDELKIFVENLPPSWDTREIFHLLKRYGDVGRIEIREPRTPEQTCAWVTFSPPPRQRQFINKGLCLQNESGKRYDVQMKPIPPRRAHLLPSPLNALRKFPEKIVVAPKRLDFGIINDEDRKGEKSMLVFESVFPDLASPIKVELDLKFKYLELNFQSLLCDRIGGSYTSRGKFKVRLSFPQVLNVSAHRVMESGEVSLVISTAAPPIVFRKPDNTEATHEEGVTHWVEAHTWIRQTQIGLLTNDSSAVTELQQDGATIDVGRWLTYRLVFSKATASSHSFKQMCDALQDWNVQVKEGIKITPTDKDQESRLYWKNQYKPALGSSVNGHFESIMSIDLVYLPFQVQYQLEVCLSHGIIPESNINRHFLEKLAEKSKNGSETGARLLEEASICNKTDGNDTIYTWEALQKRFLHRALKERNKIPSYCARIRSATVTPTTIYFHTPFPETSNRVVRRFKHEEDRFLRVKFTDELYKGKLFAGDGESMAEVFKRIKYTMKNGIRVGERTYEFLAFGNSQFREGGAYFFASTSSLSAQNIRDWMGNFSGIKVVAKYCSRLGQSFSTTRAMQIMVNIERLPDIERNGFTFSDGVGKMSSFLALMIAQEYGLPYSTTDYPSAFQFRLGGCKGVLAVDPSLSGNTIQIRPSQEKFSAMQHRGLEICRISQFSASNLNMQFILVLSALGVKDESFLAKMREMLRDLEAAMHDEDKAVDLLLKNIDYNSATVNLASMVQDGFMSMKDPFVISCLRLWRSWSIKYLKEKARIFIEDGAFVLGILDEVGVLKGHFDKGESASGVTETGESTKTEEHPSSPTDLPQIFLQIPDHKNKGQWRVIEGTCIVGRNPSLHPGDVRVVRAVNASELHHIKNCVVFPQTGDRDVPNMLSGGDLDGDDFLVMWDPTLLPTEWNHPPMDYSPPPPVESKGPVTVENMTDFFVTHMKNDNLARIAVAHRYWADFLEDGVKSKTCLELAQLHSRAVDFQKTGVPAEFPARLRVKHWPHWAEVKGKSREKIYLSQKVLGKLYNEVKRVPFTAVWDMPFDKRVLGAYEPDQKLLEAAREAKRHYDISVRRLMAKYSIQTEFEIWSTFVLEHSDDIGDYKFAETIGEAVNSLKDYHRSACFELAGTTRMERDRTKLDPFIVAMYRVTAEEVQLALKGRKEPQRGRQPVATGEAAPTETSEEKTIEETVQADTVGEAVQPQSIGEAVPFKAVNEAVQTEAAAKAMQQDAVKDIVQLETVENAVRSETIAETIQLEAIGEDVQTEDIADTVQSDAVEEAFEEAAELDAVRKSFKQTVQPTAMEVDLQLETVAESMHSKTVGETVQPEAVQELWSPEIIEERPGSMTDKFDGMPFISFPWIFHHDLGRIAKGGLGRATDFSARSNRFTVLRKQPNKSLLDDIELEALPVINTEEGEVMGGGLLDLYHKDDSTARDLRISDSGLKDGLTSEGLFDLRRKDDVTVGESVDLRRKDNGVGESVDLRRKDDVTIGESVDLRQKDGVASGNLSELLRKDGAAGAGLLDLRRKDDVAGESFDLRRKDDAADDFLKGYREDEVTGEALDLRVVKDLADEILDLRRKNDFATESLDLRRQDGVSSEKLSNLLRKDGLRKDGATGGSLLDLRRNDGVGNGNFFDLFCKDDGVYEITNGHREDEAAGEPLDLRYKDQVAGGNIGHHHKSNAVGGNIDVRQTSDIALGLRHSDDVVSNNLDLCHTNDVSDKNLEHRHKTDIADENLDLRHTSDITDENLEPRHEDVVTSENWDLRCKDDATGENLDLRHNEVTGEYLARGITDNTAGANLNVPRTNPIGNLRFGRMHEVARGILDLPHKNNVAGKNLDLPRKENVADEIQDLRLKDEVTSYNLKDSHTTNVENLDPRHKDSIASKNFDFRHDDEAAGDNFSVPHTSHVENLDRRRMGVVARNILDADVTEDFVGNNRPRFFSKDNGVDRRPPALDANRRPSTSASDDSSAKPDLSDLLTVISQWEKKAGTSLFASRHAPSRKPTTIQAFGLYDPRPAITGEDSAFSKLAFPERTNVVSNLATAGRGSIAGGMDDDSYARVLGGFKSITVKNEVDRTPVNPRTVPGLLQSKHAPVIIDSPFASTNQFTTQKAANVPHADASTRREGSLSKTALDKTALGGGNTAIGVDQTSDEEVEEDLGDFSATIPSAVSQLESLFDM